MITILTKRKALNVSQRRLATLTGISTYKISTYECGYESPSTREIELMNKALIEIETQQQSSNLGCKNEINQQ